MEWISVETRLPPENKTVRTRIDDGNWIRNEQNLVLFKGLWFFPDMSMYVYYKPTHWAELPPPPMDS